MRFMAIFTIVALAVVLQNQPPAFGQSAPSSNYHRLSGQQNPAIQYFGGGLGRPVRTGPQRAGLPNSGGLTPVSTAPIKPFSYVQRGPTVSPYLGLDLVETASGLPNYFAYVRPQLDRIRELESQQAQLNRLQKQVGGRSSRPEAKESHPANGPNGYRAQFLNTGSYFQVRR